jgi:hypothetical protein
VSPAKIELAPAKAHGLTFTAHIHSSCGQTNLSFIIILATILIISHISTGFASSIGVPSTGTKAFIGTDSGWVYVESATSIPALSSTLSPIPIIPPLQTVTSFCEHFRLFVNGLQTGGYHFIVFF